MRNHPQQRRFGLLLTVWMFFVSLGASFTPSQSSSFLPIRSRQRHEYLTCSSSRCWATKSSSSSTTIEANGKKANEQEYGEDGKSSSSSNVFGKAVHLYTSYASRLWNETSPTSRKQRATYHALQLVKQLQHEMLTHEDKSPEEAAVLQACQDYVMTHGTPIPISTGEAVLSEPNSILNLMEGTAIIQSPTLSDDNDINTHPADNGVVVITSEQPSSPRTTIIQPSNGNNKKKPRRSVLFGATMGASVALWVFSGNYIFTTLFTLMTILGQLEYYRMVMNTGVYPARRISVVGASSMFLTALLAPNAHQICLPIAGLYAMIWFLFFKRTPTSIPEVATTFTGMFYLGYVPSFWVRLRLMGTTYEPTRLAPLARPLVNKVHAWNQAWLPSRIANTIHLPITGGAIFIFWTWLAIAFSDVGAYFVGRSFGRTKLAKLSPAAGATSPNKTVEGLVGGCVVSALLSMLGAWIQKWPGWWWTGAVHGFMLGLVGLIGDLTASMLKRDAGLKDFGDLIPEHGGIMDRVDSFVWAAPYSWLVYVYFLPALKALAR